MFLDTKGLMDYFQQAYPEKSEDELTSIIVNGIGFSSARHVYRAKIQSGNFIAILKKTADRLIMLLDTTSKATGCQPTIKHIVYTSLPIGETVLKEDDLPNLKTKRENHASKATSETSDILSELKTMNETHKAILLELRDLITYIEILLEQQKKSTSENDVD